MTINILVQHPHLSNTGCWVHDTTQFSSLEEAKEEITREATTASDGMWLGNMFIPQAVLEQTIFCFKIKKRNENR